MTSRDADDLGLGPFFAVTTLTQATGAPMPAPAASIGGETSAWRNLADDLSSRSFLDDWTRRAAGRHATARCQDAREVDHRALRSVLHLGLCARILSPWVGRHLLHGSDVVPFVHDLVWMDDGTTTPPLGMRHTTTASGKPANVPAGQPVSFTENFTLRLAAPLARSPLVTSEDIAWGNVASAINGAVTTLARHDPRLHAPARALALDLFDALGSARGAQAALTVGVPTSPDFRRRSCCLLYRLTPGLGTRPHPSLLCGDCVLRERTRPRRG